MSDEVAAVVIDNGSYTCKAGLAGEEAPRAFVPSVVGSPRFPGISPHLDQNRVFVGEDAQRLRGILTLRRPFEHGVITNWIDVETIWHHIFENELQVEPEEHPVLLTEPPLNPKANREKMTQIMFETFKVPATYLADQAVLGLFGNSQHTGIVLSSGDGATYAAPVYQGQALPHATTKLDFGGHDLTDFMAKLLKERGHSITTAAERDMANEVKENHCYVTLDFNEEMTRADASSYVEKKCMHTGDEEIMIGKEQFLCPEAIFQPDLIQKEPPAVHEAICNSILKCDVDMRKELFSNIVLCGGSTMFPGFADRLQKEVMALAPDTVELKVIAPPNRTCTSWVGGSVMASAANFQQMWITKEQYEEFGPSIVHKKCF
ncbi:actin, cytoplasmic 3-like [Littorina saxatilis]|uniref:Actin n=1 Tax=Littorina saxatilis TaxID=31220 RepID=A0AAN9AY17_9CAEN